MRLFKGSVTKSERSTSGWGENEKVVGVDVTVVVDHVDRDGDKYTKSIVVHIPKGLGQPMIGDDVIIGWEPSLDAYEIDPVEMQLRQDAALENEDHIVGDSLAGEPYYDEIKQGG